MTYISDASKLGKGAGADLERVELEDEAVVESVQKGIRSRFYSMGDTLRRGNRERIIFIGWLQNLWADIIEISNES